MSLLATPPRHRSRSSSEEFWPIHDLNGCCDNTPPATPILGSIPKFSSKTSPQSGKTNTPAHTPTPVTPKKNLDSQSCMPPTPISLQNPDVSDGLDDKELIQFDDVGLATVNAPRRDSKTHHLAIVRWWDTHVLGVHCPFCLDTEVQTVTQFSTENPFLAIQKRIDIRTANCEKSKAYIILYPDEEHPAVKGLGWKWSGENKRYETAEFDDVCVKDSEIVTNSPRLADIPEWHAFQSVEEGQVEEEGDMQTASPGVKDVEKIVGDEIIGIDDTKNDEVDMSTDEVVDMSSDEVVDTSMDEIDLSQEVGFDATDHDDATDDDDVIVVHIPKTLRIKKDPQRPRRAPRKPSKPSKLSLKLITNRPPLNTTYRFNNNFTAIYTLSAIAPVAGAYSKTLGYLAPISPCGIRTFTRSGFTNQDFPPDYISDLQRTLMGAAGRAGDGMPAYRIINNDEYTTKVRERSSRFGFPMKRDNMDFYSREGQVYFSHVEKQLIVLALEEYEDVPRFGPYQPRSMEAVIHRTIHIDRDPCADCLIFASVVEMATPLRFTFEKMAPVSSREQYEAQERGKLARKPKTKMAKMAKMARQARGAPRRGGGDYASSALGEGTGLSSAERVRRARPSSRENAAGGLDGCDDESGFGRAGCIDDVAVEDLDDDVNDSDTIDDWDYEVAAVVDKRKTTTGKVQYLVQWKDAWLAEEQIELERAQMEEEEELSILEWRIEGGEKKCLVRWKESWMVVGALLNARELIEKFEEGLLEKEEAVA